MIIPESTQAELLTLLEHFTAREQQARTLEAAPDDKLLIIRADGIKASKHFLKDSLEHPAYHGALHSAIIKTYKLWRQWAPKHNPYLLGALRLSDEVSFIVNRGENYYHRRLYKITSTLASTLSGSMSLEFAQTTHRNNNQQPRIMAFDGRPLLLEDMEELFAYIRCRRLLFSRNAMGRVLRLESDLGEEGLYRQEPKLAEDIVRLSQEIDARSLWPQFQKAASGSVLYIPNAEGWLNGHTLAADPSDDAAVHRVCAEVAEILG